MVAVGLCTAPCIARPAQSAANMPGLLLQALLLTRRRAPAARQPRQNPALASGAGPAACPSPSLCVFDVCVTCGFACECVCMIVCEPPPSPAYSKMEVCFYKAGGCLCFDLVAVGSLSSWLPKQRWGAAAATGSNLQAPRAPFSRSDPSAYETDGSRMPKGGAGAMSSTVSASVWVCVGSGCAQSCCVNTFELSHGTPAINKSKI